MPEAFSISREFDFVRLDGLSRATGRPPHEWDIYVAKELIDNGLDADEVLWHEHHARFPRIHIHMEYVSIPERRSQQLLVQVRNQATFPTHLIEDIFATRWYTSRKAFIKGLTRGALGNALKTVLGIPYALRNRVASDWSPELKPMSIVCCNKEYQPRYTVDPTAQVIGFECEVTEAKFREGTVISVGLDHFEQELPRTLAHIQRLAEQYHLCNPHAEFDWTVDMGGREWAGRFPADPTWRGKFEGIAPVQWYTPTAFQELLGAVYRRQLGEHSTEKLPAELILRCFASPSGNATSDDHSTLAALPEILTRDTWSKNDIDGPLSLRLYLNLCKQSPRVESTQLGRIGSVHVRTVLGQALPLRGDVHYETVTDSGADPGAPFVLEAAAAHLQEGKRQIWTAINFAPTYGDPFFRRRLCAPIKAEEIVVGLPGLLEAYELDDDTPMVLFLHLVCPNVEHLEFSKTEINHLPFREGVGELLDHLLTHLAQMQEDEELRLEQAVFQTLDAILDELGSEERFVMEQLLEKLRTQLSADLALASWLQNPDALGRLRDYIMRYQGRNPILTHHVARPAAGTMTIPLHPERHFSLLAEHASRDLLVGHHVNKILYVQVRELEPVIVENDWLCRMDLALLRNPPGFDGLQDALLQCVVNSDLPILVLHNGDEAGRAAVDRMRSWLREQRMDTGRIIDVGLSATGESGEGVKPSSLVEMMPRELFQWMLLRLKERGIQIKSLPADKDVRQDIGDSFERLLKTNLWEGMSQQLDLPSLLTNLDRRLSFTTEMMEQSLDEQIRHRLEEEPSADSYSAMLDEVVEGFFGSFMERHGLDFRQLVEAHMVGMRDRGQR